MVHQVHARGRNLLRRSWSTRLQESDEDAPREGSREWPNALRSYHGQILRKNSMSGMRWMQDGSFACWDISSKKNQRDLCLAGTGTR
jgi:hypothetical protein